MDTETAPIENESELVEPSEPINENGCDDNEKSKVIDTVTQRSDDKETDQTIESENDEKPGVDTESSPVKSPPASEPIVLCANETEPFDIIDSDNPSENNSPEKIASETIPAETAETDVVESKQIEAAPKEIQTEEAEVETEAAKELPATECLATCDAPIQSVEVDDVDEPADVTLQVESSPEKSGSEMACLIPSPSDPMNDSANEKNDSWDQLNEPIDDVNYDDSDDDDEDDDDEDRDDGDGGDDSDDGADHEFSKRSHPKTVEQKTDNDCQVFELTDDNSSVDDARDSEGEDDIEADEMGDEEEEEEDDEDEPPSGKYDSLTGC